MPKIFTLLKEARGNATWDIACRGFSIVIAIIPSVVLRIRDASWGQVLIWTIIAMLGAFWFFSLLIRRSQKKKRSAAPTPAQSPWNIPTVVMFAVVSLLLTFTPAPAVRSGAHPPGGGSGAEFFLFMNDTLIVGNGTEVSIDPNRTIQLSVSNMTGTTIRSVSFEVSCNRRFGTNLLKGAGWQRQEKTAGNANGETIVIADAWKWSAPNLPAHEKVTTPFLSVSDFQPGMDVDVFWYVAGKRQGDRGFVVYLSSNPVK